MLGFECNLMDEIVLHQFQTLKNIEANFYWKIDRNSAIIAVDIFFSVFDL